MRHLLLPAAFLLAATSCTGTSGDDDGPIDGLVNPFGELTSECEEITLDDGTVCKNLEGASTYFVAAITFEADNTIDGTFYWTLVANEPWKATTDWQGSRAGQDGDPHCTIALSLSGTWQEGSSACGACDRGITYNTSFDASLTTCPDALVDSEKSRLDGIEDAEWGIELPGDGSARAWDTQRMWADNGEAKDDQIVVWGFTNCAWFGTDDECE